MSTNFENDCGFDGPHSGALVKVDDQWVCERHFVGQVKPRLEKLAKLNEPHVCFEVCIGCNNAAFTRLGKAVATMDVKVRDSYCMDPRMDRYSTVVLLLAVKPSDVDEVQMALKPQDWRYRSPTLFNNGSLEALYKTPEEEAEDIAAGYKKRDEAQKVLDSRKR